MSVDGALGNLFSTLVNPKPSTGAAAVAPSLFGQSIAQAAEAPLPANVTVGKSSSTSLPRYTATIPPVEGRLALPVGVGGRQGAGPVNSVDINMTPGNSGDFSMYFNFAQPVVTKVGDKPASSVRVSLGKDGVSGSGGYEEGTKLLKSLVDSVGGIDPFMAMVGRLGKESAEGAEFRPEELPAMRAHVEKALQHAEKTAAFEGQSTPPAAPGERAVWNAMQAEKDPANMNALLDRLGKQYGIPGGARPWTEWLNDTTEIPVADTLVKTAGRFKDVSPEALATVLFGEGAGFNDIQGLGADYQGFNLQERSGFTYYGLDTFADMAPALKKKGYLPADFQFTPTQEVNELGQTVNSAQFKSFEDTVLAAGAVWQHHVDMANDLMKKTFGQVPSNPETQFFYTYALFNAGPKEAEKMMRARGANYTPKWNGTERPGNSQDNAVYNSTVRAMQLKFFQEAGVFNGAGG